MKKNLRCRATKTIEDECSVFISQCEKKKGHPGSHLVHYPGQWGEVKIALSWKGRNSKAQFYKNVQVTPVTNLA